MTDYFTSEHFSLLNKWRGATYDKSDPERQKVYEELYQAFDVTKRWAEAVQQSFFPMGWNKTIRRPIDQWQKKFIPYNWGRIYPSSESPKELAYTVGIDAVLGFVVKIDVVDTQTEDSTLRPRYESIRGALNSSPIVSVWSASEGLAKSFPDLVTWSVDAIRSFKLRYEDLVAQLNLGKDLSDEDVLKHFDSKPAFQTFRASWSMQDKVLFCRLARAVHAAGLDWWHMGKSIQVRFGRKNPGSDRAMGVLGVVRGIRTRKLSWTRPVGEVDKLNRENLTESLLTKIEEALYTERQSLDDWLPLEVERPGLWPDQLRDDPLDPGEGMDEDTDDSEPSDSEERRPPVNRIYYGPPGTGKTFELSKLLKREYEQAMSAVAPAEWRNQFLGDRVANLTWWEGTAAALFDLGGEANVDSILSHPFVEAIANARSGNRSVRNTVWGALQYHTIDDSKTVKMVKRMAPAVFDKRSDSSWALAGEWDQVGGDLRTLVGEYRAGPPASDSIRRYSFVTFHQSFGYEEFVEGLRPMLDEESQTGGIRYEIRSGAFKELCRRARSSPDQRFAMVIDEINRGNISKIFGELITLIETDKREGAENAVSVTLPYSGETFSVPANVDIIGTMNTADRSLAPLDTALRRRFEFVPVMPDARDSQGAPLAGLRVSSGEQVIDVPRMLAAINQRVEALYDHEHCIGHAYFTPLAKVPDGDERLVALQQVFSTRILPLLEEYFFEDWQKIRLVLADNQKPKTAQFVRASADHEDDLERLFGVDHGLDSYVTKRRYTVQDAAFSNPDAYIGIYETLSA